LKGKEIKEDAKRFAYRGTSSNVIVVKLCELQMGEFVTCMETFNNTQYIKIFILAKKMNH
jgi:hypothetical protein